MDSQPELFAQHYVEAGLVEKSGAYWGKAGHRSRIAAGSPETTRVGAMRTRSEGNHAAPQLRPRRVGLSRREWESVRAVGGDPMQ
jgi:hypothetical protein